MEKTVRTVIGAKLQTAQKLNRPYTYSPNSIMNEQLGIFPDSRPDTTPWSQYVAIGIGGLTARYYDNNTRAELWPMPHEPRHTGLYKQVPFVIRPIEEDLTTAERQRFRLRAITDIAGRRYVAYYARKLDLTDTVVRMEYRRIVDGVVVSEPWEPSAADQHPIPMTMNPGQVLVTGDDYVAATAKTAFRFSGWDMTELVNVGNVLFNSENAILLTELAICSGGDVEERGNFNGQLLPYTEAVGVQITDFVSTFLPTSFNRAGATINMDIGSVEPLLALKTSNQVTSP